MNRQRDLLHALQAAAVLPDPRLERARKLLTLSQMPIPRIAQDCGFASQSHLTARFREAHAIAPAQFRAKAGRGRNGAGARG